MCVNDVSCLHECVKEDTKHNNEEWLINGNKASDYEGKDIVHACYAMKCKNEISMYVLYLCSTILKM